MDIGSFLGGVGSSLVAVAVLVVASKILSLVFPPYLDLRGDWVGKFSRDGVEYEDHISIKRQYWKHISGTFLHLADSGARIDYRFSGYFVTHNTISYTFRPTSRKVLDHGVGLITMDNTLHKGQGCSITFNFETGNIGPVCLDVRRV